jgi:rod shape-determining protein MreD
MIPVPTLLRYAAVGLLLLLVQLNLGYIAVENITPDLLVVMVVYIALREGQFAGELFGFSLGLLFDLISSDIIGTNALSKLLAAFVAGYFFSEDRDIQESIGNVRFLGIVALAALVHNIVYYFFYIQPTDLSFTHFFLRSGIAATLYTTVIAVVVMLVAARKQRW